VSAAKAPARVAALRRFKPYPAYKDSGVEWLENVPVHWETKRLKLVAELNPPASEVRELAEDTEVSFVPMEAVGEYGGIDLSKTKLLADVSAGYTYFRDGDVIVAKITPCFENGKGAVAAGLTNGIAFGTTELHVFRAARPLNARFLFYVTLGDAFRRIGEADMYGAGGQKRVSESFFRNLKHPLPTLEEQRAIAAFLDRETARIDRLVAKKERLIELLQEQRTALITRAVTKGLDPSVPMKDSGVEWLGEIPAHWEVRKLKHVCERVFVGIAEAATFAYVDDGVPMLRSTDVRGNRVRTDDIRRIDRPFAERLLTKQLRTGDIVTVRTGNAGVSAVVPSEYDGGQCFTLVVSRLATGHDSRYFCYWLNAPVGQQQFAIEGVGTAQVNISVPIVQNVVVCVPPCPEQDAVAELLEAELERCDAITAKLEEAVTRLKELRTALISAAVTGKIDVREEVA
jgi:type I restriction enzyme S subunit